MSQEIDLRFITGDDVPKTLELEELAESIKEQGLIHEVTVRPSNKSGFFEVVSGRKRVAASRLAGLPSVRAQVRTLDEIEGKILNIHENLRRSNLPWWEQSALIKTLHELRQKEHGQAATGRPSKTEEKKGWSMRDTATELGAALGAVSESILLADAVSQDPTLRNVSDRRTALRMVRSAAKRPEAELFQGAPADFDTNIVYCGDSGKVLKTFEDASFDACITDPPWVRFKDAKFVRDSATMPVFREIYRVLKPDSFLYLFCGLDDYNDYRAFLPDIGFHVAKAPLIWHKTGPQMSRGVARWEYGRNFEFMLHAAKGNPSMSRSQQKGSIFACEVLPSRSMVHPNEKPVKLIEEIIEDCTAAGGIILDPFAGSGSHLHAAKNIGRRYVGIERDAEIHSKIIERLK